MGKGQQKPERESQPQGEYLKAKYLDLLNRIYPGITPKDGAVFAEIMRGDGLGKCKPVFHLYGFLFGWLYLLYRRATIEAMGVLIISMLIFYISPILGILSNSLLGGFCYYYLYLNKFGRDLEICGEYNPDPECMARKARTSIIYPLGAIALFVLVALIETYPFWGGAGK
jgi:hypothetical protein